MSTVFITATGTEIGKTFVTRILLHQMPQWRAIKPLASGMHEDDPASDPALLLAASHLPLNSASLDAITPWRFVTPLAPPMAAQAEGKALPDLAEVVAFCKTAQQQHSMLLIEGAGGVLSPLTHDGLNADLISALHCPAILVAGSYLGSITHTLTALEAMVARNIPLRGIVVNETRGSTVTLAETIAAIEHFTSGRICVYALPYCKALTDAPNLTGLLP